MKDALLFLFLFLLSIIHHAFQSPSKPTPFQSIDISNDALLGLKEFGSQAINRHPFQLFSCIRVRLPLDSVSRAISHPFQQQVSALRSFRRLSSILPHIRSLRGNTLTAIAGTCDGVQLEPFLRDSQLPLLHASLRAKCVRSLRGLWTINKRAINTVATLHSFIPSFQPLLSHIQLCVVSRVDAHFHSDDGWLCVEGHQLYRYCDGAPRRSGVD